MFFVPARLEAHFTQRARLISVLSLLPAILAAAASDQSLNPTTTAFPTAAAGATHRIVVGPDGALWFTQGSPFQDAVIGRITTAGVVTNPYSAPGSYTQPSSPYDLSVGPDGALWFTNLSTIGRVTTSGTATSYPTGISGNFIATGSDGALWFTGTSATGTQAGVIGRSTTSGSLVTIPLPGPSFPEGIVLGPDGAMWFLDPAKTSVGEITTAGNVTEYLVPSLGVAPSFAQADGGEIVVGSDGALWFADGNLSIGRITTGGALSEYPVGVQPDGLTKGPDGAVWFTSANSDQIGEITPGGLVTLFNLPTGTRGAGITLGPDGALWMCATDGAIVRIQVAVANGVFAHIAAGGSWTTSISLVNTTTVPISLTTAFYGDDGSPLTLPVTATAQGASQTTTAASVNATIKPNATLQISLGAQMPSLATGWARVLSSGPVGGFAIFRTSSANSPVSEGTVALQNQAVSTITIPYDNTGGFATGVALANLSTSSAILTATSWDDSGNRLGTQNITLAASGHTSFAVSTQFPETAGLGGVLVFQGSSVGIAGLGLRFSPFGTFTSVPTLY
jgi:virginiamycin B lyase